MEYKTIVLILSVILISAIALWFGYKISKPNEETQPSIVENSKNADGLITEDMKVGVGAEAQNGKIIFVNYKGMLTDGSIFDQNNDATKPFGFILGQGQVIQGWEKGVLGMKEGGVRKLTIPSDMAYGANGIIAPDGKVIIPKNATLVFEVSLIAVREQK